VKDQLPAEHMLLNAVAVNTYDGELIPFALALQDGAGMIRGDQSAKKEQETMEVAKRKKGAATKSLKKPGPKHKLFGYEKALIEFDGKPERGDTDALVAFWKNVIYYADESRLLDEDPIYDDIEEVKWDASWKTARNQIGKLRKVERFKE
jgi:hypothetical protein